jgi:hypothetical protein
MRKPPIEDRDILVRAITAAARKLGGDNQLFPQVVTWLVDNVPALVGLFGEESHMYWEIQYLRDPAISRDDHMVAVMKRHGYQPEDLDAVRRRFDRWKSRCEDIFSPDASLGEVLWDCLRHLYAPSQYPNADTLSFYV